MYAAYSNVTKGRDATTTVAHVFYCLADQSHALSFNART